MRRFLLFAVLAAVVLLAVKAQAPAEQGDVEDSGERASTVGRGGQGGVGGVGRVDRGSTGAGAVGVDVGAGGNGGRDTGVNSGALDSALGGVGRVGAGGVSNGAAGVRGAGAGASSDGRTSASTAGRNQNPENVYIQPQAAVPSQYDGNQETEPRSGLHATFQSVGRHGTTRLSGGVGTNSRSIGAGFDLSLPIPEQQPRVIYQQPQVAYPQLPISYVPQQPSRVVAQQTVPAYQQQLPATVTYGQTGEVPYYQQLDPASYQQQARGIAGVQPGTLTFQQQPQMVDFLPANQDGSASFAVTYRPGLLPALGGLLNPARLLEQFGGAISGAAGQIFGRGMGLGGASGAQYASPGELQGQTAQSGSSMGVRWVPFYQALAGRA